MQKLFLIALAGGIGTLARYGLSGLVQQSYSKFFPWGTVAVNLLGCLAFGLVCTALKDRWTASDQTRAMVLIGFMGGFTTFSTYMFETRNLLEAREWLPALSYFALHNVGGFAAMVAGLRVGELL